MVKNKKDERLGAININNQGCLMKIIKYNKATDIIVEFQDDYKTKVNTCYNSFIKGGVRNPMFRIGKQSTNNQGCLMKIINYNNTHDITVEFQDKFKTKINTEYKHFVDGGIKNPYHPSVYNIGITGNKYPTWINGKVVKEYDAWKNLLRRCYDEKLKEKHQTYKNVTCCDEWLLFENFYEWLHSQENFDKWLDGDKWEVDKDILVKGNKLYSPDTCCLVPHNVNTLYTKHELFRGDLPIGVHKTARGKGFQARCENNIVEERDYLGYYNTPEEAFQVYKQYKENIIKQVAQEEFDKGNITKKCYDAMIKYEVEITD